MRSRPGREWGRERERALVRHFQSVLQTTTVTIQLLFVNECSVYECSVYEVYYSMCLMFCFIVWEERERGCGVETTLQQKTDGQNCSAVWFHFKVKGLSVSWFLFVCLFVCLLAGYRCWEYQYACMYGFLARFVLVSLFIYRQTLAFQ